METRKRVLTFNLESNFQSLHYLLTGETENKGDFPLNFLMCNRIGIGQIGWGRANFYLFNDVREINEHLKSYDINNLWKRYNADFFNQAGIYPKGYLWKDADIENLIDEFNKLKKFVNATHG